MNEVASYLFETINNSGNESGFYKKDCPPCKIFRLSVLCNMHFSVLLPEAMFGLDKLAALYYTGPAETEECTYLHAKTFTLPRYCQRLKSTHEMREWLFGLSHQDKVEVFEYYKLQLQIMAFDEGISTASTIYIKKKDT